MTLQQQYLYLYTFHHDEDELCQLEMRSFFGHDSTSKVIKSPICIDPTRSPFMDFRVDVLFEAVTFEDLQQLVSKHQVGEQTFRVQSLNDQELGQTVKMKRADRQNLERTLALSITGEPELTNPDILFGVLHYEDVWYFGEMHISESMWRHHMHKPHMYSTALNTRTARAVANIAMPVIENVKGIDPCCGIGTVLVEARSMGMNMAGRDMNQLVVYGSRKNLRHFEYPAEDVEIGPIKEANAGYDTAIIDMPYDLFTHATKEQQAGIIQEARRISKRVIIVTIESMDDLIEEAGFTVLDRCKAKKGAFSREILVCE